MPSISNGTKEKIGAWVSHLPWAPLVSFPLDEVRSNLQFSHPMARGEASRHIRLLRITDHGGKEVPELFVAPAHELWDPESRRLTLLFDPGA